MLVRVLTLEFIRYFYWSFHSADDNKHINIVVDFFPVGGCQTWHRGL